MQRFRTKNDLLKWVEDNAPFGAIKTAMLGGRIELLGAFTCIPGSSNPGWIVRITSKRAQTRWLVAVTVNDLKQKIYAFTLGSMDAPWEYYRGGATPLYAGDNPELYERLKNEAGTRLAKDK